MVFPHHEERGADVDHPLTENGKVQSPHRFTSHTTPVDETGGTRPDLPRTPDRRRRCTSWQSVAATAESALPCAPWSSSQSAEVTVVVADRYPNFSICGIPYHVSGEVPRWQNLAHRTVADLEATGMTLRLDTLARQIDVDGHKLEVSGSSGDDEVLAYDQLVVATGALPITPPIGGLHGPEALSPKDGVHLLHTMGDTFAVMKTLEELSPERAVIVGGGYIGLEMADALTIRGLSVTQIEQLPRGPSHRGPRTREPDPR